MKNLTRVLALVLTFAMMISTVAMAASFTDIEAGSTYAEATAVLADLGILKGYEDGTFGADKVITRAEVVAVVNRLQGLSDAAKAAGGATQYTDVPSTEWYAGDVNLATQMGIISGDGNGLFRPNDQVKYEEAVKMVVAALGYNQEYVLKRGGWPTGYLVIATEAGVSKGVAAGAGEPAYRGIVAKLAYNALTAPTFAFSSYSTDGQAIYTVNEAKIVLEEKLQVTKLTGYVVANAVTALEAGSVLENNEVSFKITENKVGAYNEDWSLISYQTTNAGVTTVAKPPITDKFETATDVAKTLGYTTDIYVKENADGDFEIISYAINNSKNKIVAIEDPTLIATNGTYASKFEGATANKDNFINVLDENDDLAATYNLEETATLVVNGGCLNAIAGKEAVGMYDLYDAYSTNDLGKIYAPAYGKVELLDNNNNGRAEFVFVTAYEVAVVDDVIDSTDAKKIITKFSAEINLTKHIKGETGFTYSLTLDGEKAEITDLQENDVIAVAMTKGGKGYDIIATRKTVSGLVSEADKSAADLADYEFIVDGTSYKVANLADKSQSTLGSIGAGYEVVFYLDTFGNVAYADITAATAKNYGFIVGAYTETGFEDVHQVKILDKNGEVKTYTLADNVRYARQGDNGQVASALGANDNKTTVAATVYADIAGLANGAWVIKAANASELQIKEYADRIVTFKTNSDNKITEIVMNSPRSTTKPGEENYLTFAGTSAVASLAGSDRVRYNAKTQSFEGRFSVSEETVVFNLPINANASADDFKVGTIASLSHEEQYDVAYLAVDKDNVAGAIIIVNDATSIANGSNLAVATKIMATQNADLEAVYNVTFLQNGEVKTLTTTSDAATAAANMQIGHVFEYSVDEAGAIDAIGLAGTTASAAFGGLKALANSTPAMFNYNGNKEQYVFGVVYGKSNNKVIAIANNNGTAFSHAVPETANIYLVDVSKLKADGSVNTKVSVSSMAEIRAFKANNPADTDYAVFMKYYNEEITDVVIIKGYRARGPLTNY